MESLSLPDVFEREREREGGGRGKGREGEREGGGGRERERERGVRTEGESPDLQILYITFSLV